MRAVELKDRTLAAFPVRVWRSFLQNNGFLLSAGMGYYVLFALFAILYIAFAGVGVWLGASETAIDALIQVASIYLPGLVGEHGLITPEQVTDVAISASSALGITGAIAAVIGMWTAIGAVTYTRRAVRDIFGLPLDSRSYFLLKVRDLFAGALFGAALLVGAGLSWLGVWALELVYELFGWSTTSVAFTISVRAVSIVIALILDIAAIALLVRFLTGTSLRWRYITGGAVLGGLAMVILQLGVGLLLAWVPSNPLLASFTVVLGLLLWCRVLSIVVLIASSWMAMTAQDHDHPVALADEATARDAAIAAKIAAATDALKTALETRDQAPWYQRFAATREVRAAEHALADALADAKTTKDVSPSP